MNTQEKTVYREGRKLFREGQFFMTHDLLKNTLKNLPNSIPLKQLSALSLNKIEAYEDAINILLPLTKQKHPNKESLEETWGNLGSSYKGIWNLTQNKAHAILSRDNYLKGFDETGRIWTGTNSATMSWVLNEQSKAEKLAKKVVSIFKKQIGNTKEKQDRYWALVNGGEAYLILKNSKEAKRHYDEAFKIYKKMPGFNFHFLSTAAQQIQLLKNHGVDVDQDILDQFKPLQVVLFAGHMIDRPGASPERFPTKIEELVRQEISAHLKEINPQIGYSGAACGADIIFLEEMLKLKTEVNIFLPFSQKDFIEQSVGFAGGKWIDRFKNVIEKANAIKYVTTEDFLGDTQLFSLGGSIFQGYGRLRALRESSQPVLLSLWDHSPDQKVGGTSHIINSWADKKNLITIDINKLLSKFPSNAQAPKAKKTIPKKTKEKKEKSQRTIKTLLFSDIAGFSKLEEGNYPYFVKDFLKRISKQIKRFKSKLDFINTWGDAIFAAMPEEEILEITDYAFCLLDAVQDTRQHFPNLAQLNIRIALHVGPVFEEIDPITERPNIYGCHVNRAARLEPVTKLGHIYATEQFAALLTIKQSEQGSGKKAKPAKYSCHYVGNLPLVKNFGSQTIYKIVKKA